MRVKERHPYRTSEGHIPVRPDADAALGSFHRAKRRALFFSAGTCKLGHWKTIAEPCARAREASAVRSARRVMLRRGAPQHGEKDRTAVGVRRRHFAAVGSLSAPCVREWTLPVRLS